MAETWVKEPVTVGSGETQSLGEESEDYAQTLPLAEFWLNRENVMQALRKRGIQEFVWLPGEAPCFAEAPTEGFVYLGTAVNWVLGLAGDVDTPIEGQAIRRAIQAERAHGTWPVKMLDRRDRGMGEIFEFVHFGGFAEWVFRARLPMSPRLKKTRSGKLSEWLVVIRKERAEYQGIEVSTLAEIRERDTRLAELGVEEAILKRGVAEPEAGSDNGIPSATVGTAGARAEEASEGSVIMQTLGAGCGKDEPVPEQPVRGPVPGNSERHGLAPLR